MSNKTNQIALTILAVSGLLALSACHSSIGNYEAYTKTPIIITFEKLPQGERDDIAIIADAQSQLHKKRYTDQNARKLRNVHPKAHGCVNATFTIDPNIKKEFQVGLFSKPGHKFENVKIRYSNATGIINSDVDARKLSRSRGMAIQIPNVKGTVGRVIEVPGKTGSQDFLMINQPVFAIKNAEDYLELTNLQLDKNIQNPVETFLGTLDKEGKQRKREGQIVKSVVTTPLSNPLEAQYFSGAPFSFGKDRVMKFSAKPCNTPPTQNIPNNPSDDYLRQAMKKHLEPNNGTEACFDFLLQVPPIPVPYKRDDFGIEDATFEWIDDGEGSLIGEFPGKSRKGIPYEKVAEIRIPKQDFDTRDLDEACEALELNPWHSLVEHQPLGGINRLRNPVYSESAKGRKK